MWVCLITNRPTILYIAARGLGPEKIRKWLVYIISWYTCKLPKYIAVCIYTTTGALHAHVVVYVDIAVYLGSLHVYQEMVYTRHFLIFSRPKPGGGVYIWCPHRRSMLLSFCDLFSPKKGTPPVVFQGPPIRITMKQNFRCKHVSKTNSYNF